MTIKELQTSLYPKTIIQKDQLISDLIGKEILVEGSILDIGATEIKLEAIYTDFGPDNSNPYNHLYFVKLKYDNNKFAKMLFSFQNGDDVKIITRLIGRTDYQHSIDLIELELLSISKIGTTRQIRLDAYLKMFQNSSCFIATACYGNLNAPEVLTLRQFRDEKLINTYFGNLFVKFYYTFSPFFAALISKSEALKKAVRIILLNPIVTKLQRGK